MSELLDWRVRDRLRTLAAGLVLCLHLGVDPPDVWKPSLCARWECWIDPVNGNPIRKVGNVEETTQDSGDGSTDGTHLTLHLKGNIPITSTNSPNVTPEKIRDNIARNLLIQYETWQPRVRYKTLLDPTAEDLRKLCTSLRKSARNERVLLHYNGHGVPRPTRNGELWVFNKQFTQYIPVNVADILAWCGCPAVWILDCPASAFLSHALQKIVTSAHLASSESSHSGTIGTGTIHSTLTTSTGVLTEETNYAASITSLPLNLIIFSACDSHETLPFTPSLPADILTSCLTTPLDMAIRWHCYIGGPLLPKSLTTEAALKIPGKLSDRRTPLGELNWIFTAVTDTIAWLVLPRELFRKLYRQDLLIASLSRNYLLAQRILKSLYCTASCFPALPPTNQHNLWTLWDHALDTLLAQISSPCRTTTALSIKQSTFFPDQLDAFELWLRQHSALPAEQISGPPDHLPAALQVLLSQNLRPRALMLFAQFCDFGPWACLECLHVGIHPYILKLITSTNNNAGESVSKSLLHIWTRLMSVDQTCKADLLKDSAFLYFCNPHTFSADPLLASKALVTFGHENPQGKDALLAIEHFRDLLESNAKVVESYSVTADEEMLWRLLLQATYQPDKLRGTQLKNSDNPEIRAAFILANPSESIKFLNDPSPLVRLEVLNNEFALVERFLHDPFDPIATKAKESIESGHPLKSYFIAHHISVPTVRDEGAFSAHKCQALNQLEVDSWLERPISTRKFDTQIAVIEASVPIKFILFHPLRSQVFLVSETVTEGCVVKCWNWEDDPDVAYDNLNGFSSKSFDSIHDAIMSKDGHFIVSSTGNGSIRFNQLKLDGQSSLSTALSCNDKNVRLLQSHKNESIYFLVGDSLIQQYNSITQKLTASKRSCSTAVSCLHESDEGLLIGTVDGTIEFFKNGIVSILRSPTGAELIDFWPQSLEFLQVISSDGCIRNADPCDAKSLQIGNPISCFSRHPQLPFLLAYGNIPDQSIRICELADAAAHCEQSIMQLQGIKYHDGFLGQRLGYINKVTWHPGRMVLGTITSDVFVSIYGISE